MEMTYTLPETKSIQISDSVSVKKGVYANMIGTVVDIEPTETGNILYIISDTDKTDDQQVAIREDDVTYLCSRNLFLEKITVPLFISAILFASVLFFLVKF